METEVAEVAKVEPKVVTMEDLEDEDDDRKKRKKKKGKKEETEEKEEGKEEEGEEEEGSTMKTAAQKKKEKKEREKQKKMVWCLKIYYCHGVYPCKYFRLRSAVCTCLTTDTVWLQIQGAPVGSRPGLILSWRLIMKLYLRSFSSLPPNHSRRVVVSYKWKYVHKLLFNGLFKLAQEKMWLSELTLPPWP